MNLAALLAGMASCLGLYIALLAWRYRLAPGLRDQGWFALVSLTAAGFAALNVVTTSPSAEPPAIVWAAKVQLFLGTVHAAAWLRYASAFLGRPLRHEKVLSRAAVAFGALLLVPGLGFTGRVSMRPAMDGAIVYRDAEPTWLGLAVVALSLAVFLVMAGRFVAGWWHGVRFAGHHVVSLALLAVMGVNDGLNLAGVLHGLYLLDLGFLLPVAAVSYALGGRVVEESGALARLRSVLERAVEDRTEELGASKETLHRAEKLAALGQFSAGVSHEVSNPAAVVAANLRYLEEALREGALPGDAAECLAESREAVDRIARLTRQLQDASRFASADAPAGRVALADAAAAALAATPRLAGHRVTLTVPPDLHALAHQGVLRQVLERLLDNAARSIPSGRPGRIAVRGERTGGRALLTVEDDGIGMDEETLRRAFDPFFSTRRFGDGSGLGLAVARGLIQSMRGDLRLESAPTRGTRAVLELHLAEAPPAPDRRAPAA